MNCVNWYEYMKNPYEKQNCIINNEIENCICWSDLITSNNFMLDKKKYVNIINMASRYIINELEDGNLNNLFDYLRGDFANIKKENYELILFPQLPYLEGAKELGVPRLMDYFSIRTGILYAIIGEKVDKEEIRKASYLLTVSMFLNDDAKKYIENILNNINNIDEIKNKLEYIDLCFMQNDVEKIPEYNFDMVKGGVVKVKEYLLETNKIKEIRGASLILDKINRKIIPLEVEKNFINESLIYAGGGNILLVVPKGCGKKFARHIEEIYEKTTIIAQNVAISKEIALKDLAMDKYHKTMTNIEYLLKERQMSKIDFRTKDFRGSFEYILKGVDEEKYKINSDDDKLCDSCNNRVAKYKLDNEKYCLSCLHKNIIGGKNARISFQKEFEQYCSSNEYVNKNIEIINLKDIKSENGTNSIGVIYGDGNNMGAVINKVKNILQMKYFSDKTENSVKEAVYGALAKNLKEENNVLEKFEIIALGGDDIFIIVPGDKAISISKDIGNRFDNVFFNYTDENSENLTMSLGVTISKYDKPVQYLFDMSIQLLKSAKSKAKKVKKGTMDFMILETDAAVASNVKFLRSKINTASKTCTLKPYTFKEIENLINVVNKLKCGNGKRTFRSKAYRFMETTLKMEIDEGNLFYAYQRVKDNDKKILDNIYRELEEDYDVFEGKRLYLLNKKTRENCSIWLDVVELWDYVGGGVLHE